LRTAARALDRLAATPPTRTIHECAEPRWSELTSLSPLFSSGNPNHKGLTKWPAYDGADRATMLLNIESKVVNAPSAEERKLWDGII
jgi:carboxylesterase type B